MKTFDVAVVGAGPAGSATAILLARAGFSVAILDRSAFPRAKPCGEFLNPGALAIWRNELGVPYPTGAEPVGAIELWPERGEPLVIPLEAEGLSVPRTIVDAHLLMEARRLGAEVFENHSVLEAREGVSGADFRYRSRVVIAADGSHSRIARSRDLVVPISRLQRVGFVAHLSGIPMSAGNAVRMFGGRSTAPGVSGFCGQAGGSAVFSGVLPRRGAVEQLRLGGAEFVTRMTRELGLPSATPEGPRVDEFKTTSCFGHRLRRVVDGEVVFVGDAARFVDPFTGEGVHHALEGAVAAARAVSDHLRVGWPLTQYVELRRDLERRYLVCDLIQALVHRPSLFNRIVANLRRRPASASSLIAEISGMSPPGQVLTPRMIADALIPRLA